jgi:ATP-dependent 26S proteasome regulatory subunit
MSKRPLPLDMHDTRSKNKRPKLEEIVTTKNVIVRNDDDPHILSNIWCEYVMLGNFIYKVKPYGDAWIRSRSNHIDKTISLTLTQYNDVKKYIFNSKIIAKSYNNDKISPIEKLTISLTTDSNFKIVTKHEEICQYIKKMLFNHIVTIGQNFIMYYHGIYINIRVNVIDTITIGKISNTTDMDIKYFDDNITIYNKRISIASNSIKIFVIKCIDLNTKNNSQTTKFPLIMNKKTLETYARNAFKKSFTDNKNAIYINDGIEYTFNIKITNQSKETKIKNTYILRNDSLPIVIQSSTPNLIITNRRKVVRKICFSVLPIHGQKYEIDDHILFVDDLVDYINNNIKIVTLKQTFKYQNNGNEVHLLIDYINPRSGTDVMYEIDPNQTKIIFNTTSKFIFVKNRIPNEIEKVIFKVKKPTSNLISILLGEKPKSQIINSSKLEKIIKNSFPKRIATKQQINISNNKINCIIKVEGFVFKNKDITIDKKYSMYGQIVGDTEFKFEISNKEKLITINNTTTKDNIIDNPIVELEKYVGGISDQLDKVVRKICLSRGKLKKEFEIRGLKADKGLIFYGEPGTGKTTLARNLGKILGCEGDRFRLMSGPEIFNKWVGESEANIRRIFKPAKDAWKKHGSNAPIYMVVIDEIDAMLPVRSGSGGNPVRDSVVNQFLAEMDGLEQFENLICIGITNRLELLDPAAIRSGRFGAHIKIGLPNKEGRKKIFEIHSKKLNESGRLGKINFDKLVEITDKFNGADIENVVAIASMTSIERLNSFDEITDETIETQGKVIQDDFIKAIKEVREIGSGSEEIPPMYR